MVCCVQRCDDTLLREALSNLVDNSLKYCDRCDASVVLEPVGLICVSCQLHEEREMVRIQVWNSATSFDEELESLFKWDVRGR